MSTPEQPPQAYYPSARVDLVLRLEDYGAAPAVTDGSPAHGRARATKPALEVRRDGDRHVLVLPGGSAASPQDAVDDAGGYTVRVPSIVPRQAKLSRNGVRMADSLALELDYDSCPIDPRAIRSCAVTLYVGTLRHEEYSTGIRGGWSATEAASLVADSYVDAAGVVRSNIRFQGFVDKWSIARSSKGGSSHNIDCTDNTRLIISQEGPPGLAVSAQRPIDEAVAAYMSYFPQLRGMAVEYRPAAAERPTLDRSIAKHLQPDGPPVPKGGGAPAKFSAWDYLTTVCASIGHVIRVEGTTVIIQRARTVFANKYENTRVDDPFTGRILSSGRELRRRLLVYGRDVEELSIERAYASAAEPQNIEVRSYVPRTGRTITARHPPKVKRQESALPGDGAAEPKFKVVEVSGIENTATLKAIAQEVYELQGRKQIQVRLKTRNLASYGGGNESPDLFDLQAGDAVDVEVARDPGGSTDGRIEAEFSTVESTAAHFEALGYDRPFAEAYAAAYASQDFPTTFRLRKAEYDWSSGGGGSGGVGISLELCNFVEARVDAEVPDEPPPDRVDRAPKGSP